MRDHEGYRDKPFFCYRHLELDNNAFAKAAAPFLQNHSPEKVLRIDLLCEGGDICAGETIAQDNVTSYIIYYIDSTNFAGMDYVVNDTIKERYRVSNAYASVSIHYLFEKSKITDKPSVITFANKNRTLYKDKIKLINPKDDVHYQLANAGYKKSSK